MESLNIEQQNYKRKYSRKSLRMKKRYKQRSKSTSRDTKSDITITLPTKEEAKHKIQHLQALILNNTETLKQIKTAGDLFNSTALADEIYERDKEKEIIENFIGEVIKNKCNGTLYICGKPGTGKTATLNCVLKSFKKISIGFFNAMNYNDAKSFLQALNKELCEIAGKEYKEIKDIQCLINKIHKRLKSNKRYL